MFKTALTYGAISGLVVIGVILAGLALTNNHATGDSFFSSEYFGYLIMIVITRRSPGDPSGIASLAPRSGSPGSPAATVG